MGIWSRWSIEDFWLEEPKVAFGVTGFGCVRRGGIALRARQVGEKDHPGTLLRRVVLPALELSVRDAARDLGVTRQTLHRVCAGSAALSPDMAMRLEKLCGVPWQFWLERQHAYEVQRTLSVKQELISRIPSRPLPEAVMKQIGARRDS
jgi:addiction module HigA family antidote